MFPLGNRYTATTKGLVRYSLTGPPQLPGTGAPTPASPSFSTQPIFPALQRCMPSRELHGGWVPRATLLRQVYPAAFRELPETDLTVAFRQAVFSLARPAHCHDSQSRDSMQITDLHLLRDQLPAPRLCVERHKTHQHRITTWNNMEHLEGKTGISQSQK